MSWSEQQVQDYLTTAHAIAEHWALAPARSWPEERAALVEEWSQSWAQAWPAAQLLDRFDAQPVAPDTAYATAWDEVSGYAEQLHVTEQQYEEYLGQGEAELTFDPRTLMEETVDEVELATAVDAGLVRFEPIDDDTLERA